MDLVTCLGYAEPMRRVFGLLLLLFFAIHAGFVTQGPAAAPGMSAKADPAVPDPVQPEIESKKCCQEAVSVAPAGGACPPDCTSSMAPESAPAPAIRLAYESAPHTPARTRFIGAVFRPPIG